MDKLYFAAEIQQEYADIIRTKALDLGIPEQNILFSHRGCTVLNLGVYIKFNNIDTYQKFNACDVPGIIEKW